MSRVELQLVKFPKEFIREGIRFILLFFLIEGIISLFKNDIFAQLKITQPAFYVKIIDKKENNYFSKGIFNNLTNLKTNATSSKLMNVRHFYSKDKKYERVTLEFEGAVPIFHGSLISSGTKLSVDFKSLTLSKNIEVFQKGYLVQNVMFMSFEKESLTFEMNFKDNIEVEVFYLNSPSRLVFDIKNHVNGLKREI